MRLAFSVFRGPPGRCRSAKQKTRWGTRYPESPDSQDCPTGWSTQAPNPACQYRAFIGFQEIVLHDLGLCYTIQTIRNSMDRHCISLSIANLEKVTEKQEERFAFPAVCLSWMNRQKHKKKESVKMTNPFQSASWAWEPGPRRHTRSA